MSSVITTQSPMVIRQYSNSSVVGGTVCAMAGAAFAACLYGAYRMWTALVAKTTEDKTVIKIHITVIVDKVFLPGQAFIATRARAEGEGMLPVGQSLRGDHAVPAEEGEFSTDEGEPPIVEHP